MESIWQAGISIILWIQGLGDGFKGPMLFFTFLGSEEFLLLALPIIYWCVDAKAGIRVGVILLFTGGVNDVLKLAMHGPRPYWYSTAVKAMAAETSFGVPSGHAQIAAGLWGMIAAELKQRWAWWLAAFLILMIGLSRLYLAVHFPHDVLLGWLFGLLILWAFVRFWDPVAAWFAGKSTGQQVVFAFLVSALLLVFGALAFGSLRTWNLPTEWIANAQAAGVDELPAPITLNGTLTSAGALFGLLAGLAWINARGGYDASGTIGQRLLRFLVGVLGVLVLWYGLGAVFPREEALLSYILRYFRYTLIGFWISAGAPWVFMRIKLAHSAKPG